MHVLVFAPLYPDGLREPIVAGRDVVDYDGPLPAGGERAEGPGILHVGGTEEVLLLEGGEAVNGEVSGQKNVLGKKEIVE